MQLLQSHHPALLVTWGLGSPKILLPATASAWPADRIRVVLAHELAHVVRHDWLTQISAELLRALYWFNPLVWLAARRLREESERACDDAVLETGDRSAGVRHSPARSGERFFRVSPRVVAGARHRFTLTS